MKNIKSGLYICKCYWKNSKTNELFPVLKFGMTKDIDKRMNRYNENGNIYKLISFYPAKKHIERRERDVKSDYFDEHFRMTNSEHMPFESGLFKYMHKALTVCTSREFREHKNPSKYMDNLEEINQ
jgi:hypothetical protein